ncbi:MAG: carbohydrate-binding protein, partial [Oscillospiraceae bacterium]|nr:carbohydrate-binding protein [Oscillospiraceae bacterium]
GNWVCYKNVDVVAAIGGATFRAAKDVGTMTIELRLGGPDGQLLAAAEVKGTQDHNDGVKGDQDWWTYYTYEATFTGVLPLGRHDIYLVFSGSVNLSWFSLNADTTVIPTVIYGDVNGSGSVDIGDARMVLQHLVGKLTLTPEQLAVANVSGGDQLSISDARLILQYLVDKIDTFPAEK